MNRKSITIYDIIGVGFLAALVFVGSQLSISIPTAVGNTRIHFGNIFCLLAGFLLGGWRGGLAAGLGSMLYDFTNPLYIASAPFTFVFKFMMAFVCGTICFRDHRPSRNLPRTIVAGVAGSLTYVVLYLGKNFLEDLFFLRTEMATALIDMGTKAPVSLINGAIAVAVAVPLAFALRAGLLHTPLYRRMLHLGD